MKNTTAIVCLLILLTHDICVGQIQAVKTPTYSGFQPVYNSGASNSSYSQQYQNPIPQVQVGATAQDIYQHQNVQPVQVHVEQKREDVEKLIQEIKREQQYRAASSNTLSLRYVPNPERTKDFPAALQHLKDMLAGKLPLSVADAYYTIENAYGNSYLTKQQYDSTINQSVDFIKTWMQQNGLNLKDNYEVHFAIKKFMSEELAITKADDNGDKGKALSTITHKPFFYDYDDYEGQKDYRNFFVTKCFATGAGQCASMPGVYLVLAEKLGVKAYLSIAPYHSFIKHPDNSGYIINYEPTSNWEISDKWYMDNLFVSSDAVRSGLFLDTLNSKQVVANCIFDLCAQYMWVDNTGREKFITDCIDAGIPYFPKNNNFPSLIIYGMHIKTMLREIMRKNNITNFDDIPKNPQANAYYQEYIGNEAYIKKLGFRDLPTGMYEEMMKEQEFKGKIQEKMKLDGKQKRNLFSKVNP